MPVCSYPSHQDKGKPVEKRGRKATDLRDIPMIAGLPTIITGELWAPDMEIKRAFPAIQGRFEADGIPVLGLELRRI